MTEITSALEILQKIIEIKRVNSNISITFLGSGLYYLSS